MSFDVQDRSGSDWGSAFDRIAEQMRSMLREVHGGKSFHSSVPELWQPRVNLYETLHCYFVCVELAGVESQKIDVHLEQGRLMLGGTREKPSLPECPVGQGDCGEIGVHLMEIDSGQFERKITIPSNVDVDRVDATCKDGYLWITLPRTDK
jgi:HSP20 family protein